MKNSERIHGIDKVMEALPPEYRYWHGFGRIKSLNYKLNGGKYDMTFLLTDLKGKYDLELELRNVSGKLFLPIGGGFSGLEIEDMMQCGYESESSYHFYDFEQSTDTNIYCEDIYVKLVCIRE